MLMQPLKLLMRKCYILQKHEKIVTLSLLGLNSYEERVYRAVIELGKGSAAILSQASDVPYGRIYDVLSSLEAKGLIKIIPEPTKHYIPASPDALKHVLLQRKRELEALEKELNTIKAKYQTGVAEPVQIAHGRGNFYRLLKSVPGSTFDYSIKYTSKMKPEWKRKAIDRKKAGVDVRTLTRYDKDTKSSVRQWLAVQKQIRAFENEGVACALRDGGAVIGLLKSNTTIVIRDPAFTSVMKRLFLAAYNHAPEIPKEKVHQRKDGTSVEGSSQN